MRSRFAPLILLALLTWPLTDQRMITGAPAEPEFEVSTVKLNRTSNGYNGGCHGIDSKLVPNDVRAMVPLGRCRITAARLSHLMAIAYRTPIARIKGGPDWVWGVERFDVEGKADNPAIATEAQLLVMLQELLAERFQLKFHRETIDLSGHALVIAKNGHKLKEATPDGTGSLRISGAAIYKFDAIDRKNLDRNTIIGERVLMSQLAGALGNLPDFGPVIDNTGLRGAYDFRLTWEPDESVSSVLREQLGLELESQKVPVELLVIDSAAKPIEH